MTQDPPQSTDTVAADDKAAERPHRLRKGDEAGFRKFLETNTTHIQRFALTRLANDVEAAEEVVQATITEAVRNLDALHSGAHAGIPMLIWVFRLCRLEVKEYVHRRERQTHGKFTAQNAMELRDVAARLSSRGHEVTALCGDAALWCLAVVVFDRLPELEAAALELKYLGGASNHDVARLLDLTEPEAQVLLARARILFKTQLDRLSHNTRS